VKRTPLDDVFSFLVRERADWTCERCFNTFPEGDRQGLHCSHFFSRSIPILRVHPLNASAHCMGCHSYLGGRPLEHVEWFKAAHGALALDDLRRMSLIIPRFRKQDRADMLQFYRSEKRRLLKLRDEGHTGRLEFDCAPVIERALLKVAA